ncbi:actin cortical patch SUR7/pH-response regulator pali [Halteromyces radiatus]|uniref:actin cortical patch SUR7/pH-response regulator pali n=1 Tax=Halteromyces radiatus TaxID=101107 RepID=UPI00221FC3DA|nr:actin cortical patch SUR7/pH-response regulator pali [Halteromyces radiatus]KAI8093295.1 actin cortical patch SUR7/pH-response regulator pali [Halteromyces radiatus]
MAFFAFVATFTTFAALILEIFTMIGNLANRAFLRDLFFAKLILPDGTFFTFGLWNYCMGNKGDLTCSTPEAAFVWTSVPQLASYLKGFDGQDRLFMASFVLYWIGIGLTLFALVITLFSHFRRSSDVCASFVCIISFVVILAAFVILIVVSAWGIRMAKENSSNAIDGYLGPSTWMTLGAMVALLLSSVWYFISCCCGSGRRVRDVNKA